MELVKACVNLLCVWEWQKELDEGNSLGFFYLKILHWKYPVYLYKDELFSVDEFVSKCQILFISNKVKSINPQWWNNVWNVTDSNNTVVRAKKYIFKFIYSELYHRVSPSIHPLIHLLLIKFSVTTQDIVWFIDQLETTPPVRMLKHPWVSPSVSIQVWMCICERNPSFRH